MRDDGDLELHGSSVVWCKTLDIFVKVETRRHVHGIEKECRKKNVKFET